MYQYIPGPPLPQVLDDPSRAAAIHPLDSTVFLVAPHEVGCGGRSFVRAHYFSSPSRKATFQAALPHGGAQVRPANKMRRAQHWQDCAQPGAAEQIGCGAAQLALRPASCSAGWPCHLLSGQSEGGGRLLNADMFGRTRLLQP